MPHSLRARLSGLRYKKIISDKDYDRLCRALDQEKILDKIRAEIEQSYCDVNNDYDHGRNYGLYMATQILDKYEEDKENE